MDVKKEINDWIETLAKNLLNDGFKQEYTVVRNNLKSNDIDLLVTDTHQVTFKMDVQYSFDFKKYGDIRIDLVSAGIRTEKFKDIDALTLNTLLSKEIKPCHKLKEMMDIKKKGKYFESNEMKGVIYFLYDEAKPKNLTLDTFKKIQISKIVYIPTFILLNEINKPKIKHIVKINDKQKHLLHEKHDSAFICLNLKALISHYNLPVFNNREELNNSLLKQFEQIHTA